MPPEPYLLAAGLPLLLPLFAHCMPPPQWDNAHTASTLLRRQPCPAATPAAAASTAHAAIARFLDGRASSLEVTPPSGTHSASAAASARAAPILFLPPDHAIPSPADPPSSSPGGLAPRATPGPPRSRSSDALAILDAAAPPHASPPAQAQSQSQLHAPPSARNGAPPTPLLMAYYPGWAGDAFPPEKVDFGRFDWVDFAFAVPDAAFGLGWDGTAGAPDLLRRLVARAHAHGKRVKLSVGGWTGSRCVLAVFVFSRTWTSPWPRAMVRGRVRARVDVACWAPCRARFAGEASCASFVSLSGARPPSVSQEILPRTAPVPRACPALQGALRGVSTLNSACGAGCEPGGWNLEAAQPRSQCKWRTGARLACIWASAAGRMRACHLLFGATTPPRRRVSSPSRRAAPSV